MKQTAYDPVKNHINREKITLMNQILDLRKHGFTYREIDNKLGCSHRTIRKAILNEFFYRKLKKNIAYQPFYEQFNLPFEQETE